jgi:hypothetical protein
VPFEGDEDVAAEIPGLNWASTGGKACDVMWKYVKDKSWTIKENSGDNGYVFVEVECVEVVVLQNPNPDEIDSGDEAEPIERCILNSILEGKKWKEQVFDLCQKELHHSESDVKILECTHEAREVQSSLYPRLVFECKTYSVEVLITGSMQFEDVGQLESALSQADVPIEDYGVNGSKSVAELFSELSHGQAQLSSFAEYPKKFYINKKVVSIYLEQDKQILMETHRVLTYKTSRRLPKKSDEKEGAESQADEDDESDDGTEHNQPHDGSEEDLIHELVVVEVNKLLTEHRGPGDSIVQVVTRAMQV